MKKCTSCGAELDGHAFFCAYCGNKLPEDNPSLAEKPIDVIPELIPEEIKKLDASFSELTSADEISRKAGAFIKSASEKFI